MRRDDLVYRHDELMALLVKSRQLGDFDPHCVEIRTLLETQMDVLAHLIDAMPRPKGAGKK